MTPALTIKAVSKNRLLLYLLRQSLNILSSGIGPKDIRLLLQFWPTIPYTFLVLEVIPQTNTARLVVVESVLVIASCGLSVPGTSRAYVPSPYIAPAIAVLVPLP